MIDRMIVANLLEIVRSLLMEGITRTDLNNLKREIMSAISDFAAKMKAHQDKIATAVSGLTDDVKALNDKIEQLQNTAGAITPEDQALLDEIEKRGDTISTTLAALDSLTPPATPTPTE